MSMLIEKSLFDGSDIYRYDVNDKGENQYWVFRSYFHGFTDNADLTKEERRVVENYIEDMDTYCGHRWQMPLQQNNTLIWVGNRFVRFIMINGCIEVVKRGQKSKSDKLLREIHGSSPVY